MTVARYLARQIGARIVAVLVGLLALGLTLDLIENATEVIDDYGLDALPRYALLRAPLILLFIAPLGMLAGAMLGFLALSARNELLVLRASGLNTLRMLLRLLPLAVLLGLAHYQLVAHVAPTAERSLVASLPDLFEKRTVQREFWLREPRRVIRVGRATRDGRRLDDVSIFELAPTGELDARLDAARAFFGPAGWRLEEVTRRPYGGPAEHLETLAWPTRLTPRAILGAAYRPQLIDLSEARQVLQGALPGGRGVPFYEIQVWRSYAAGAVPFVMLIFAALASFGLSRSGGRPLLAALGLAGGAAFVLADGVFASLGELGVIGARMAALLAPALFTALGLWAIIVVEE